jgi:hypothetical protein
VFGFGMIGFVDLAVIVDGDVGRLDLGVVVDVEGGGD